MGVLDQPYLERKTGRRQRQVPDEFSYRSHFYGTSFIFFLLGARYGYLAGKGQLEPKGISVTEVRRQALEKVKSEAYIAKTAREDPDPEVRQKALEPLKEITV